MTITATTTADRFPETATTLAVLLPAPAASVGPDPGAHITDHRSTTTFT